MDVAVASDGKVVLGGYHIHYFGHWFAMWGEIVRLNADGSLDTSFGRLTTTGDRVYDVALTPAGAMVHTYVESDGDVGVRRFDPQGNPDVAFSRAFKLPGYWIPAALEFQSDGSMLVGMFHPIQFAQQLDGAIGRLTPSGGIDTSFGGGDGMVFIPAGRAFHNLVDVVVQPSGRIVALGSGLFGTRRDFSLAGLTAAGDPDPTFRFGDTANARLGQVFVDGSDWAPAFRQFLAGDSVSSATYGQALLDRDGTRRISHVPWVNLNRVAYQFDRPTAVERDDLHIYGMDVPEYAIADFRYDPGAATAVWTLAAPIEADRLMFELDPAKFGRGELRLDVLPGDVDASSSVLAGDASAVKRSFFRTTTDRGTGDDAYSAFRDVNGSGVILADDFAAVKQRFFTHLPGGDPAVATAAVQVRAVRTRTVRLELLG